MKTAHQIKKELSNLYEVDPRKDDKKEVRAARKQVVFLTCCLVYVETDPRPEFIMKQIKDLDIQMQRIDLKSPVIDMPKSKDVTALLKMHYAAEGMDKLKDQMKVLKYILNG